MPNATELFFFLSCAVVIICVIWQIQKGLRREEEWLAKALHEAGWYIKSGGDSVFWSGVPRFWASFPRCILWRRPLAIKETPDFRATLFGVMPDTRIVLAVQSKRRTFPRVSLTYRPHLGKIERWLRSHPYLASQCPNVAKSWIIKARGDQFRALRLIVDLERLDALYGNRLILGIDTKDDWILVTSCGRCSERQDMLRFASQAMPILKAAGIPELFAPVEKAAFM